MPISGISSISGGQPESYRQLWSNPASYDLYEERRKFVTPALCLLAGNVVTEYFCPGDVVLEVGAGDGALRRYAGNTARQLIWIESEHRPDFLQLPRTEPSLKTTVALPDLSFRASSLHGIISLGVLDTLSSHDLEGTARSAANVLAIGGRVIHLLDMSPDYSVEIKNAQQEGLFPLPFNHTDPEQTMGLHYIATKNLPRRISRLPINSALKSVFTRFVTDPEALIPALNRTAIVPLLGTIAEQHGMVVKTEVSWLDKLAATLATVFTTAGLIVERSEIVTAGLLVGENVLPPEIQGKGATHIVRKQGVVDVVHKPGTLLLPGTVSMQADAQLLVARKPLGGGAVNAADQTFSR